MRGKMFHYAASEKRGPYPFAVRGEGVVRGEVFRMESWSQGYSRVDFLTY
jgi:gamma-glutamylcyclotransferase (GGCT)/AIG2-like uncharacterized protein YtfP